jgi:hypothetical protein
VLAVSRFQCEEMVKVNYLDNLKLKVPRRCRMTVREVVKGKRLCGSHARWAKGVAVLDRTPPPPLAPPPVCCLCKGTKMLADDDDEPVLPCLCTPDGRIYANQGTLLRKRVKGKDGVIRRVEHPWQKEYAKCARLPRGRVAPGKSDPPRRAPLSEPGSGPALSGERP